MIKEGILAGYTLINLIADDCGCYGLDIGSDFGELMDNIYRIKGKFSLEIHYVEPSRFTKHFKEIKKAAKKGRVAHLNIPIQTGSQRVLKLMNRNYDISEVVDKVKEIKTVADVHISTDIIMGFPTETIDEFENTLRIVEVFDLVELFLYSPRKGTAAAAIKNNITKDEMMYRHRRALKLEQESSGKYNYERRGQSYVIRSQ
jgi:tRNA A37 methylthiotransferase MiaB